MADALKLLSVSDEIEVQDELEFGDLTPDVVRALRVKYKTDDDKMVEALWDLSFLAGLARRSDRQEKRLHELMRFTKDKGFEHGIVPVPRAWRSIH